MIYPLTLHGAKTSKLNENLENLHLVSASATEIFVSLVGYPCAQLRGIWISWTSYFITQQRDEGNTFVLQLKR